MSLWSTAACKYYFPWPSEDWRIIFSTCEDSYVPGQVCLQRWQLIFFNKIISVVALKHFFCCHCFMQISNLSHCILDICVGGSFRIDIIGSLLSKSRVRCYIHVLCFKTFCNVANGVKQMIVIRAASSEKMPSNKPKMRRFISSFARAKYHPFIHSLVPNDAVSGQWRSWSDAQADLCLHCPYIPDNTFSHGAVHFFFFFFFFFVSKEFQSILTTTIKETDPQLIFYLNLYLFIEMLLDSCRPDNGLI